LLFRFGIVSCLLGSVLFIFVTLALYRLFKGVDESLAVLDGDPGQLDGGAACSSSTW
jgi:hypothetical protein